MCVCVCVCVCVFGSSDSACSHSECSDTELAGKTSDHVGRLCGKSLNTLITWGSVVLLLAVDSL